LAITSAWCCSSSCEKGKYKRKKKIRRRRKRRKGRLEAGRRRSQSIANEERSKEARASALEHDRKLREKEHAKRRTVTTLAWPLPAAQWRGVYRALSAAEAFAPDWRRSWTTSSWPCRYRQGRVRE